MSRDQISDRRCELLVEGVALDAVLARTATAFALRNVEPLGAGELDRLPALAIESDPAAALLRLLDEVVELAETEGFVVQGVDKLTFGAGELRAILVGVNAPSRIRGRATQDDMNLLFDQMRKEMLGEETVQPESPTQEVVAGFFRSMETADGAAFAAALAEDVTWTAPKGLPFGGTYRGKHAVLNDMRAKVAPLFTEPAQIELLSLIGTGRVVAAEFIGRRKTVTGREYENHYVEVFEVEDGLIKSVRQYMDTHHFITAAYD